MQTLILEGIATSGKSTIIKMLESALSESSKVKVIPETETIMAIVDNTDVDVSLIYLKKLITKSYKQSCDVIVFDRLYLTHIFRTKSSIQDFQEIEAILKPYRPLTIYLKVNEALIAERVEKASNHRDDEWKDYIFTKGKSFPEIAEYYISQQRNQLKLLADSSLPYMVYDTSDHSYESIVEHIINGLGRENNT